VQVEVQQAARVLGVCRALLALLGTAQQSAASAAAAWPGAVIGQREVPAGMRQAGQMQQHCEEGRVVLLVAMQEG
jgi:hypothetical protein